MQSVREEYERRREMRRATAERWERRGDRLANLRLLVAVVAVAVAWAVFGGPAIDGGWLFVPVLVFAALFVVHAQVNRRRDLALRAVAFYDRGIARLTDAWPGTGATGNRYLDPGHPCALDLDLFGRGSLFELVSTARTRAGEDTLAAWLGAPAGKPEIEARQTAVRVLEPRLNLREEIALLGEDVPVGVDAEALAEWGAGPRRLSSKAVPLLGAALAVLGVASLVLWLSVPATGWIFLGIIVLDLAFYLPFRKRVGAVIAEADRPATELELLACILARLEAEEFEAPLLARLRRGLQTEGAPPSLRVRKLVRLCQLIDAGRNQFFAPIAGLLLWNLQLAFALERWRKVSGGRVGMWLDAVGRIEALSAIASYAHEHPDDPFPEILEEERSFRATGATHPLLPAARAVRNDVTLGAEPALLVVSGSNMSGKSTLLRTVGTNAVLALAGAPVRARSLRLSLFRVASSMRVQDDLLAGASRFYAELTRLKAVVDLTAGELPVLFLLDELLHGTNSKDRAAGAEGLVQGLLGRGAVGLVTTHDLALGAIADSLGSAAANVHFEDRLVEGEMEFDYRLRPGVVKRSNALELMRAVGLDV
jgi:hypothetical protein